MTDDDVANMALAVLDEAPITALSDNVKAARLLNRVYEQTRRAELAKHMWVFALEADEITGTDTESGDGTLNWTYELPATALTVVPLTYDGEPTGIPISWRREGRLVYSDQESPRKIRYVVDVEDPDDWDPLFVEVMVGALAIKVVHSITHKTGMIQIAQGAYDRAIQDALRVNAVQRAGSLYSMSFALQRGDNRWWR